MTVDVLVSACAAAVAVALMSPSRVADRRLRAVCTSSRPTASARKPKRSPYVFHRLAAVLAAVAVAMFVGGLVGLVTGGVVALVVLRAFARLEPAAQRERRRAIERDLPVALDLFGACLSAGAPVPDAIRAVITALGGPVGAEFELVTAALDLGVGPADAWLAVTDDAFGGIGRTFARAMTSGARLADVASALADDRRASLQADAAAAARRAGVAVVGPLGLCFLPAFLCTAVVPVVTGLALRVLT